MDTQTLPYHCIRVSNLSRLQHPASTLTTTHCLFIVSYNPNSFVVLKQISSTFTLTATKPPPSPTTTLSSTFPSFLLPKNPLLSFSFFASPTSLTTADAPTRPSFKTSLSPLSNSSTAAGTRQNALVLPSPLSRTASTASSTPFPAMTLTASSAFSAPA
ncbi:hypothetical protein DPSP01_000610 [Paraphaeosphaeria sporulosa]